MDEEILYNSDLALSHMADQVAQLSHDNAILRAAVKYYKDLVTQLQTDRSFAKVPFSEAMSSG